MRLRLHRDMKFILPNPNFDFFLLVLPSLVQPPSRIRPVETLVSVPQSRVIDHPSHVKVNQVPRLAGLQNGW